MEMAESEISRKMRTLQVLIAITICSLLLLLTKSSLAGLTNHIIRLQTTSLFQLNAFKTRKTTMKQPRFGRSHLLTTEHLKNIIIDNEKHCSHYKRFLVYKCDAASLCGGLGDREKGIVSSFLLALLTNRTFVIHMTEPCELAQFWQPNVYNWSRCKTFLSKVHKENISEFNYVVGSRKFLKQIQDFDFDSNWTKQVIVLRFNAYVVDRIRKHNHTESRLGWLLKSTNEEAINMIYHTLFKPNTRILEDVEQLINNHIQEKHLVCCHIRKGKNPSIPTDNKLPRGTPNESVIFDFLNSYDNFENNSIYIATDSDEVRKQAEARLDTYININRPIVHIDRLGKLKKSRTEACEGFYTVLLEQYILSQCDTLVLTRSNFGGIAAYIRGTADNLFLYHPKMHTILKSNFTNMQQVFRFI